MKKYLARSSGAPRPHPGGCRDGVQLVAAPADAGEPEPDPADAALDLVYERHAQSVAGWARRLAGPGADLEDLIHEVFLIALRRHGELRSATSMRSWLFRITWHVVRGRRRRERIRRWLFSRYAPAELGDAVTPPVTPLEQVLRSEQIVLLYRALDRLPENDRTALILYEIDGLPGEEIAHLLDVDVGALWVRLHRARRRLVKVLAKQALRERPSTMARVRATAAPSKEPL